MRPLVVIGAGGFGREAIDVVEAVNATDPTWQLLGVVDDGPTPSREERLRERGIELLGTLRDLTEQVAPVSYVIGIGSPPVREKIAARLDSLGFRAATVIHPRATVGSRFRAGEGTVVCAGVQISTNVRLGRHVHLNPNATIGHDTTVQDFTSVNPGAILSGELTIGRRALIGAGAVILQGLVVGQDAVVGAAACVTRDVREASTVKGVPAR